MKESLWERGNSLSDAECGQFSLQDGMSLLCPSKSATLVLVCGRLIQPVSLFRINFPSPPGFFSYETSIQGC